MHTPLALYGEMSVRNKLINRVKISAYTNEYECVRGVVVTLNR